MVNGQPAQLVPTGYGWYLQALLPASPNVIAYVAKPTELSRTGPVKGGQLSPSSRH